MCYVQTTEKSVGDPNDSSHIYILIHTIVM